MSYEKMLEAVNAYFNDRSRSQSATRDGLKDLQDEVTILIDSLDSVDADYEEEDEGNDA